MRIISASLLVVWFAACSTPVSPGAGASTEGASPMTWSASLETSGGFTGRGTGNVAASSDGAVIVTDLGGRELRSRLTPEEREKLQTAIVRARPETWREADPPRGADLMTYLLEIERDGVSFDLTWHDGTRLTMDVSELHGVLSALRTRVIEESRR